MIGTAAFWMRRRAANALAAVRRFPTTPRAKRLARYAAGAVAAAGLLAGGLAYSPSFRRHFAARVMPAQAFVTNYLQHHRKQSLFASLHGRVLELGPGVGANFAYFPPHVQWQGVEHNPELLPALYRNAEAAGTPPALLDVHVQPLAHYLKAQPSNSLDAVVSTYVLSSVPEYREVIGEVHRVLKPGGRFYFVENVARDSGTVARGVQVLINPLYRMFADGCDLTHETDKAIASAGFDRIATEWWGPKSDWPIANAQARAQRRATRAAARNPDKAAAAAAYAAAANATAAVSTAASGSVLPRATGTRPVIAGIAVKSSAAPVAVAGPHHAAAAGAAGAVAPVFPTFSYGLFQQQPAAAPPAAGAGAGSAP